MNRKTDASSLLHGRNIAQDALDFFPFLALSRTHMWVVNKQKSQSKWEQYYMVVPTCTGCSRPFFSVCHYKLICWVVSPKQKKNGQYLLSSFFLSVAFFSCLSLQTHVLSGESKTNRHADASILLQDTPNLYIMLLYFFDCCVVTNSYLDFPRNKIAKQIRAIYYMAEPT